jgi:ATP-dependent protease ClpP protease subunit
MRPCYTFIAAADNKPPVLSIFDEIGFWGVQAKDFLAQLSTLAGDKLDVEISSPGGDVFAAVAMYNGLRASGKEITTKVMGVAASAASLVFMAGDNRVMPKNTHLMVHNPWSFAAGNAAELRDTADFLDKIGTTVRGTYAARSGMTDEAVTELLTKDTWLTADEALANGMATQVIDEVKAQASFDMDRADLPEAVRAVYMATKPKASGDDKPDDATDDKPVDPAFGDAVVAMAKDAGFATHAPDWALACTTLDQVTARIASAREIKALCDATGHSDQTDDFIKASKTVAQARADLVRIRAEADVHIDTARKVDTQQSARSSAKPKVSTASIWASHRAQSPKK